MDALTAILAILVAIAILFAIARRFSVPYPTLFVLGGLGLGFLPGLPARQLALGEPVELDGEIGSLILA